jgi:hypothetical protein
MWRQRAARAQGPSATPARARRADSRASQGLVRATLGLFAVFGALGAALMSHADVRFVDRVVAAIDGTPVTASDVAIARALGLFELNPEPRAIEATDVERYVDGRLLVREATRLGLETTADERTEAWAAAAGRAGGQAILEAWLRRADVDPAWARRLVDEDLTRRRFVELRFRDLAFVSEADVTAAMGSGANGEAAREAVRARLEDDAARRRLGEWLVETRARSAIRRLVDEGARVPDPLAGAAKHR